MKETKNNENSEIKKDWEKPLLKVLNFKKTEGSNSAATGEATGYIELES
jgi:hypothetical protein